MQDYTKTMTRRRDEELLQIAYGEPHTEYLPEAIEAAQAELDRRGVSDDDRHSVEAQVVSERAETNRRPSAELTNGEMIGLLVIGPFLLISVTILLALLARGYRRKAIDAIQIIALSFVVYLLLGGVVLLVISMLGF